MLSCEKRRRARVGRLEAGGTSESVCSQLASPHTVGNRCVTHLGVGWGLTGCPRCQDQHSERMLSIDQFSTLTRAFFCFIPKWRVSELRKTQLYGGIRKERALEAGDANMEINSLGRGVVSAKPPPPTLPFSLAATVLAC